MDANLKSRWLLPHAYELCVWVVVTEAFNVSHYQNDSSVINTTIKEASLPAAAAAAAAAAPWIMDLYVFWCQHGSMDINMTSGSSMDQGHEPGFWQQHRLWTSTWSPETTWSTDIAMDIVDHALQQQPRPWTSTQSVSSVRHRHQPEL
ncbi:hypothetical protein STEG23_024043 [Scotinomys teguina]